MGLVSLGLVSLVYLLFPGTRETLQGGFLEGFEVISRQFSVNFPVDISGKNIENPFKALLKSPLKPFKAFRAF